MKSKFKFYLTVFVLTFIVEASNAQNWLLSGNAGTNPSADFIGTTDSKTFRIRTNNLNRMSILQNGKVGIGINSPEWKLDVKAGSINTDSVYRINGVQVLSLNGVNSLQLGPGSNFVGIGTANPLTPLHITTANQEPLRIAGSTSLINGTGMFMSFYENNIYRGYIGSYSGASTDVDFGTGSGNANGSVHLTIGAIPRFTLTSSGHVGIGTTSPVSKLSVIQTGTTTPSFELSNTSKGPNISYGHFGANGDWFLRSAANNGYVILQDQSAGYVGVGTTYVPSGYKMAVNGRVICTELKVQLASAWPDYVFKPEYSLMSLPELSSFINSNGHLPGIPCAETVESSNGIEVGEMQRLLVEKIEELTLYILKQEEKIQQLQQSVEQLKK
ncbi:MAG: hypothetical protein ACKVQV_09500 [Bacteroidia bacterium]